MIASYLIYVIVFFLIVLVAPEIIMLIGLLFHLLRGSIAKMIFSDKDYFS